MTIIDYENLTPTQMISQYILEQRGKGLLLAYSEHAIIEKWVSLCPDIDQLLLILNDVIPEFFATKDRPKLSSVDRKIVSRLEKLR